MPEPWPMHARQWRLLGPPLRPSREDVAIVQALASTLHPAPAGVLLLGVTPELATLAWPPGTRLVAVDRCEGMIAAVWPTSGTPAGARAILGDWRALPLDDASVDLVLGDAVTTVLTYPEDTEALFREVRRVLRPGGRFVTRAFVPPAAREDVGAIARDLEAGRIGALHPLKLRLLMALHPPAGRGVRLADAWDAWRRLAPDPVALATRLGWGTEVLATIDVYRGSETVYAFPSVAELDAIASRAELAQVSSHAPPYALGDRCPTVVWARR